MPPCRPRSLGALLVLVPLLASVAFAASDARADEPRWKNPFASGAEPAPGRLSAAIHGGSVHGRGIGADLGVTAFPWLEGKLSYGYNVEHSAVAYFKGTLIPTALLSPYLVAGYGYGLASLRGNITLHTHQLVAGLGLQARFADRYFVGAETTANIVLLHRLTEKSESYVVEISDPWTLAVGFAAGVWFL